MKKNHYIGRFAPSPTGPLHLGSLVAALGSYLDARSQQGKWLVRIEDIDPPRCVPGAAEQILHTLQQLGLQWDGEVLFQSQRAHAYNTAFKQLESAQQIYPCGCTRREIADSLSPLQRHQTAVYPGTCRNGLLPHMQTRQQFAWRVRTLHTPPIVFHDRGTGSQTNHLTTEVGDFVIKRADGLWAYQLAVVVDDAACGVTHIVRGVDLLTSTARQIYLQQLLKLPTPHYWHLPLVLGADGEKLSKQHQAQAIDATQPIETLNQALQHFGLPSVSAKSIAEFWPAALSRWQQYRESIQKFS